MTDARCPIDLLRDTLAKMRADVDGMIGRELARLAGSCVSVAPNTPLGNPFTVAGTFRGPCEFPAHDHEADGAAATSRLADKLDRTEWPSDAASRLDALARHLEGRLKRPRSRAGTTKPPPLD